MCGITVTETLEVTSETAEGYVSVVAAAEMEQPAHVPVAFPYTVAAAV